jgi:hypothetical protein
MPPRSNRPRDPRERLLVAIGSLAEKAIFGTLSETYRTYGTPGCRCHGPGPKHGPHLYISYRTDAGKTGGFYVPKAAQEEVRAGVAAWQALQQHLRELAELTRDRVLASAREARKK